MRPDTATLTLNFGPAGSHINFVRLARSGIEENGFNTSTEKGKLTLWFRREWPVDGGAAEGGARFPLIRDIGGFEISLISPADRKISRWPVSGSQSDTPPRLLEFKIQRRDGQVFESAAWIRTDIEAFAVASDT